MISKVTRMACVVVAAAVSWEMLVLIVDIGAAYKKFPSAVIFAFIGMLLTAASYTYSRFFDNGVFLIPGVIQWALVVMLGTGILMFYMSELSKHENVDVFSRFAPVPALMAFFYAVVAVVALGGDGFLGPLRSVFRLGRPSEKRE